VRVDDVAAHEMHSEWYSVPKQTIEAVTEARRRGGRVVAAGTTTLRALETVAAETGCFDSAAAALDTNAVTGETNLFIIPGYRFRVVERLITNFHLPKSTLLMLVSAFGGIEHIRRAYRHAIDNGYRFYSYGDAMLIERAAP
jgi:S-adenosylmethionine:tRNA ribosyltransferase-isomerase